MHHSTRCAGSASLSTRGAGRQTVPLSAVQFLMQKTCRKVLQSQRLLLSLAAANLCRPFGQICVMTTRCAVVSRCRSKTSDVRKLYSKQGTACRSTRVSHGSPTDSCRLQSSRASLWQSLFHELCTPYSCSMFVFYDCSSSMRKGLREKHTSVPCYGACLQQQCCMVSWTPCNSD